MLQVLNLRVYLTTCNDTNLKVYVRTSNILHVTFTCNMSNMQYVDGTCETSNFNNMLHVSCNRIQGIDWKYMLHGLHETYVN